MSHCPCKGRLYKVPCHTQVISCNTLFKMILVYNKRFYPQSCEHRAYQCSHKYSKNTEIMHKYQRCNKINYCFYDCFISVIPEKAQRIMENLACFCYSIYIKIDTQNKYNVRFKKIFCTKT